MIESDDHALVIGLVFGALSIGTHNTDLLTVENLPRADHDDGAIFVTSTLVPEQRFRVMIQPVSETTEEEVKAAISHMDDKRREKPGTPGNAA